MAKGELKLEGEGELVGTKMRGQQTRNRGWAHGPTRTMDDGRTSGHGDSEGLLDGRPMTKGR